MQKARTDSIHETAMHPPIKVAVIEDYAPTRIMHRRVRRWSGLCNRQEWKLPHFHQRANFSMPSSINKLIVR